MTLSITDLPNEPLILIAADVLRHGSCFKFMVTCKKFKSIADETLKRIYDRILLANVKDNSLLILKMRELRPQNNLPAYSYSKLWAQLVQMTKRMDSPMLLGSLSTSEFDKICQDYENGEALFTMLEFLLSKNDKRISFSGNTAQENRKWLDSQPKEIEAIAYFNLNVKDSTLTLLPAEISKFPLISLKISQPCKLASVPDEIIKLTQLEELEICGGNFVDVLPSLQALSSLKRISIPNNKLLIFPDLTGLKQLVKVDVSGNKIQSFPAEIWDRDYELWIEGNCIDEIPPEIGKEWQRLLKGIDEFISPKESEAFKFHISKSILIDDHNSSYASLFYYSVLVSETKQTVGPIKDFLTKKLKRQLTMGGRMDLDKICKEMEGRLNPPQPINGLSKPATQIWMHCQSGERKIFKRALLNAARAEFEELDPKSKEKVYELIYRFADSPNTKDRIQWGKENAFEKTFRFLMAYDCVARGMFKV